MNSKIKYTEERNKLKIEIFPKLKKVIIFGYLFFYIFPFLICSGMLLFILFNSTQKILLIKNPFNKEILILLFLLIGSLTIAFIFLRRIFEKEVIIIDSKELIIKKVMVITLSRKKYNLKHIKDLVFAGREDFTDHYLNVKGFDYLGIGTGEKEVHFMLEDGNIQFEYLGTKIRFGRDIYFNEIDELIMKLKKHLQLPLTPCHLPNKN
ncbi:MAG: hypothetical protein CVT95_10485 [Bacteroidetes bacterium HGW-Bacteroidetes-12]|nr:MAG: hypothetical protein CVT95_10485 [Bacteroidetes bacterium HGW-Bacteroidetes-12]